MNGKLLRRLCAVALSALMICSAGQTAGISLSVFAEGEASNTETDNQLVCTAVCSAGFVPTGGNAVVYCSAEGGGGSYTFAVYTRQSTAAEWTLVQDFSENTSVKVNASQAGEFEIKVIAMDVSGNTSDKIISITAVDKLESAASLSEDVVVLGNTVTIHNETSKGVAPYKYSAYYRIAGNTSWKVISEDSDEPDIDFVPKAVETYEIKSTVRDSSGKDINKEMVLKVISQLKNLSEFSSTSIPVNGSADIHCKAKGGLGSLKFAVSYRLTGANNWSVLQDYSANNEIVFAPGAAGVYEVKVAVMDERDVVVEKKTKITVADTINNLSDISADAVVLGNSITLSGAASGGIAPYTYAAFYRLEGNENWIKFQDYSSNSEIVFTPKGTGTYELRSTVKDSVGKYSRKEFTIQSVSVLKNLSTVSSASIGVSKETNINCTAKGGLGQLKYSVYSRLSSDTEWTAIQELSDNKTVTFSSDTVGVYYIKVDVVDEMGKTVSKQIKVKVADTLENTVELSSDVAVLGETVTIDSEASGGIAPYTYSAFYRLKGNTNWIKLRDYSENSTVEFTPKASGEYELRYNTKDSVGNVVKKESVLKVVSALRNTSLRSAPNVTVGKSIDINCAAKGGLGNYKFAVYARLSGSEDSVMLQDFSENTKVSFAPDKSGVYEITVIATDDMQKTAEKKISVTAIDPLSNIIELSDDTTVIGKSITINCEASGGTGPYTYSASYRLKGNENWIKIQDYSTNNSIVFTPKGKGTYELRCSVKDSENKAARNETTLEVVSAVKNLSKLSSEVVVIGKGININCAATGGIGDIEYSITASLQDSGLTNIIQEYSGNTTLNFVPENTGVYNISVKARDQKGNVHVKNMILTVVESVKNTSSISAESITLGETVTINCSKEYGADPCKFAVYYRKSGSEKWAVAQSYKAENTVTIKLASAAVYEIKTSVKDAGGNTDDKIMTVKVVKPLSNTSYLSSESITEGRRVKICCSASGGFGEYHYAVSYKEQDSSEWNEICGSENTASVYFTPSAPGKYAIQVTLTDEENNAVVKSLVLEVISKEEAKNTLKWNGHTYKIIHTELSPDEAESFCEESGGYLVSITSEEEQSAVAGLLSSLPNNTLVTIGATDFGHEGKWKWFSGEEFVYSNWAEGEPDNGSGWGQDYAEMDSTTGLWYDYYGEWDGQSDINPCFICEWDS